MEVYDYMKLLKLSLPHYSEMIRQGQLCQSRPAGCQGMQFLAMPLVCCRSCAIQTRWRWYPLIWHLGPQRCLPIQRSSRSREVMEVSSSTGLARAHEVSWIFRGVFLVGAARRCLWKLAPVDSDTVVLTATVPSLEGWIVQSSTCPCSTRPPPKAWI